MFSRCDFGVQDSGEFSSSDFDLGVWHCYAYSWVIRAQPNQHIRLKFVTFQLSDSQKIGHDYIEIYDGRNSRSTLLGTFTGVRRPFVIQSSGRFMFVKFRTSWRRYRLMKPLRSFKGVYTFNTTKGKFSRIYPLHAKSSEQIERNTGQVAVIFFFWRNSG